jgi:hypothetical protein
MRGDIVIREGHHVFVVLSNGVKMSVTPASSESVINQITNSNTMIKQGQKHANDFVNHDRIAVDGVRGNNTNRMAARVLQHALNLDYKAGLNEDGDFGAKSKAALGEHNIAVLNKSYLVTAAEILYELKGVNPNGVEYPGIYGKGLTSASGKTIITATDLLALLK